MDRFCLIRHSLTQGNLAKRYIGKTDEALCQKGLELLAGRRYPAAEIVFCSPMKRCVETAGLIYPGKPLRIVEDFRECDFGRFENKNYLELAGNALYNEWIKSGGASAFPGGESVTNFKKRSVDAFTGILLGYGETKTGAAVVHNGTIMAIMEALAAEKKNYFDWGVECCGGYVLRVNKDKSLVLEGRL